MSEGDAISQEEIDAILRQAAGQLQEGTPPPPESASYSAEPSATGSASNPSSGPRPELADDIQLLLAQAEQTLASADTPPTAASRLVRFSFPELAGTPANTERATIELLRDVELEVKIELGRAQMYLEDVLKLRRGAVVQLDKLAGDPVDIYANGRLIGRGEVLVLNDNFCVRVTELVAGSDVE
ncbi:MAG: hypothetical protein KatS3mg110_3128 [Pirellulaceae bacterium]|nr:MAG: hypothetical protein KatS3mg110_3128 [Pirellulaceae bacterium]